MATIPDMVYDGILEADGTIRLARPPGIEPGPVRVTLREISAEGSELVLIEDPSWGGFFLTPCDLPLPGPVERIYPRHGKMPLPDPLILDDD